MKPLFATLGLFALALTPNANAQTTGSLIAPGEWKSKHYQDHPLVGRLVFPGLKSQGPNTPERQAVAHRLLFLALRNSRYVLLGENHDNPDHHILQARLIEDVLKSGRRPAVVLEMVPRSYAQQISRYDLTSDPKLDDFAKRLDWEERGWYTWDLYRPIGLAAAKGGLRMFAGNLDRQVTRALSQNGLEALPEQDRKRFGLDADLSDSQQKALNKQLAASHCGLIPEKAFPRMSLVQRARDGSLAEAMVASGFDFGSILIAGNQHVRKDRGVPRLLAHLLPGFNEITVGKTKDSVTGKTVDQKVRLPKAQNFVVGLIEVQPGRTDPFDYELKNAQGEPIYDAVIFTPKADITDPCVAMREQFKNFRKKAPAKSD